VTAPLALALFTVPLLSPTSPPTPWLPEVLATAVVLVTVPVDVTVPTTPPIRWSPSTIPDTVTFLTVPALFPTAAPISSSPATEAFARVRFRTAPSESSLPTSPSAFVSVDRWSTDRFEIVWPSPSSEPLNGSPLSRPFTAPTGANPSPSFQDRVVEASMSVPNR